MARKTGTKKPSKAALAAAAEMLAPLKNLLSANAALLTDLNKNIESLAHKLDRLQAVSDPKLLTEPAPPASGGSRRSRS